MNSKILKLIELGGQYHQVMAIQARAREIKPDFPRDGCGLFLSLLLQEAGIDVHTEPVAQKLADALAARGWKKITDLESVKPGDVGVTEDLNNNGLADHIFLVIRKRDASGNVSIADNQADHPHSRNLHGGGKTPTAYLMRSTG